MGLEEKLPGGVLLSTVEKVAGYWIDCCYQAKEKYPGFSFREFFKACKAGNPDRLLIGRASDPA